MGLLRTASFLLFFVSLASAQSATAFMEWWLFNGKVSDPCATNEAAATATTAKQADCAKPTLPDPAITVLVPTAGSEVVPALITITGRNLPNTWVLTLAQKGLHCDNPEPSATFQATVTCINNDATLCSTGIQFAIPATWQTPTLELEAAPRSLCFMNAAGTSTRYTGFKIGVVWSCDNTVPAKTCSNLPPNAATAANSVYATLTFQEAAIRQGRTTCCRHATVGGTPVQMPVGQCINPNLGSCCQGAMVEATTMRCCNADYEIVQSYSGACPCKTSGPNCPTGETCCTLTKYPELISVSSTWPVHPGQCFNVSTHRCCDTGLRYDPGTQQCCNITGIQSISAQCPCDTDADCQGGQSTAGQGFAFGLDSTMRCCKQFWPEPFEAGDAEIQNSATLKGYSRCNKYVNFPYDATVFFKTAPGTAPRQTQRCLGSCIDNRFQICCNGITCHKEFDRCCNSTCCNKYIGNCIDGIRAASPNNRANYNDLNVRYEVCTTIEVLNPLKSFWIYVWPAYLLAMTLLATAFVIAFINKSSRRSFSVIERTMITIAFFTIIFALPCFFAPIYKYGVWVVIASLIAIITAVARMKWLNLVLVIVSFLTVMYLVDPFHGNNYFNFASLRVANGDPDPQSAGILYAIWKIFHSVAEVNTQRYCTTFYDYFSLDPQIMDPRIDNVANPTFGYCGHGWTTALLVFECITLILVLTQFILDVVAYILRFREERSFDPIELEVRGVDEVQPGYPAPAYPAPAYPPY